MIKLVCVAAAIGVGLAAPAAAGPYTYARGEVSRVVDGDTIRVKTDTSRGPEAVRLLGIDTPETIHPAVPDECGGLEAKTALADVAGVGQRVRLDASDVGRVRRDRYGRLLAYVYGRGGTNVNARQIRLGWAEENGYGRSHRLQRWFDWLEAGAQRRGAGMWGLCHGGKGW
jgi:micrococcal nuclease